MQKPSTAFEFDAIGTHWWIETLKGSALSDAVIVEIRAITEEFDRHYSRFRDDSLITNLARSGTITHPPAEMIAMLDFAKEMYHASDGAFNISIGGALHKLGYGSRSLAGDSIQNPWQVIRYNKNLVTAPVGTVLDFGGFGKWWLIDIYAGILKKHSVAQFIINGGGDIYVDSDSPIEFALEDPRSNKHKLGQTRITKGALAASSTLKRTWNDGEMSHHHIFDPETNMPIDSTIIADFIQAESALIADTMATILILKPSLNDKLTKIYGLKTILIPKS